MAKEPLEQIRKGDSWYVSDQMAEFEGQSHIRRTIANRLRFILEAIKEWENRDVVIGNSHQPLKMLDAGCGDFNWMHTLDLSMLDCYIGCDIVKGIIEDNRKKFKNNTYQFHILDIVLDPLPTVDLVFCRDCTQHLFNAEVFSFIHNLKKSSSVYFLTNNYPHITKNKNIPAKNN